MVEISQNDFKISIKETEYKMHKVEVSPLREDIFVPISSFETIYPSSLIKLILDVKGGDYLCDELAREEDAGYVRKDLEDDLRAYFNFDDMAGKRILDFGCGSGASTMILSRMFPQSEIVGVELEGKLLSIARARQDFYQYPNVSFHQSPNGNELPVGVGQFDLVIMSAVYEHLLPEERETVMPLVWNSIKPGGHLFLNMTPHRFFPIEHHTTALPFINYLPDSVAYQAAQRFSKRIDPSEPWEILLRRGIRGGTENEIAVILNQASTAELLEPQAKNIKDRIDLWYSQLNHSRLKTVKKSLKSLLKAIKAFTGLVLVPNLSLVFKKV